MITVKVPHHQECWKLLLNSLTSGKFEWNFRYVIFKRILVIDGWGISCEIVQAWMPLDFTDDQSTLVQVMAWCWCNYDITWLTIKWHTDESLIFAITAKLKVLSTGQKKIYINRIAVKIQKYLKSVIENTIEPYLRFQIYFILILSDHIQNKELWWQIRKVGTSYLSPKSDNIPSPE